MDKKANLLANYETHKTRLPLYDTNFDEVCVICGARDNLRGLGDLGLPCRGPRATWPVTEEPGRAAPPPAAPLAAPPALPPSERGPLAWVEVD